MCRWARICTVSMAVQWWRSREGRRRASWNALLPWTKVPSQQIGRDRSHHFLALWLWMQTPRVRHSIDNCATQLKLLWWVIEDDNRNFVTIIDFGWHLVLKTRNLSSTSCRCSTVVCRTVVMHRTEMGGSSRMFVSNLIGSSTNTSELTPISALS